MSDTMSSNGQSHGENAQRAPAGVPDNIESDPNTSGGRGRRNKNKNRGGPNRGSRFKGECEALTGYVYDSGMPHSNQDLFVTTTKKIAEYVSNMTLV